MKIMRCLRISLVYGKTKTKKETQQFCLCSIDTDPHVVPRAKPELVENKYLTRQRCHTREE